MSRSSLVVTLSLCAALLYPFPAAAGGQGDALIRGEVVAGADRSAVPGATVTLTSAGVVVAQATSDAAGRFALSQLPPDRYLLSVSAAGFAPQARQVLLEPREVSRVAIALDVAGLAVELRVTDEAPSPGTHSPSSTLLTTERLEAMPALQRINLPDAIVSSAPGMIRGHDDFVHVRGHEIALNPVINGVSFWENAHAALSAGVSAEIIETANVMTGGFPAEYGNRFGGVVDITTRSGLRTSGRGSFGVSAGGAGRRRASGDAAGRRGTFGYFVSGGTLASDRFFSPPDAEAIHDAARGAHAFTRLDWGLRSGAMHLIVMGDGINAEIPKTPQDAALRPHADAEQRARQQTATLSWMRAWSSHVVSAAGYQRWSRVELLPAAGPLTARGAMTRELATLGGKVDVTRLAGGHTIKAGLDAVSLRPRESLDYDYDGYRELTHLLGLPHIHVADQVIRFSGRESGGQISAFVQDSVPLGAKVTADIGVRVDRHALVTSTTHLSPRVNLAYQSGGGAVLHASYNHFFVPPPVEGVLSSSAGLTAAIREVGQPLAPLEPTIEDQFEAGASMPSGPLRLAVTAYYRATDNPVHTTVWPDARIYSYASFDRARAYGLEAKAELPAAARRGFSAFVNYALGRVYFHNPVTGGFITEAAHLTDASRFLAPMDQTHTLTGGATYRHDRSGAWAGVSVEYGSGTPVGHGGGDHEHGDGDAPHAHAAAGTAGSRVAAHALTGMTIGMDLMRADGRRPRLTLRVDVENVANRVHVIAREGPFSPAQYSIPRLVSMTARVRF